MNITIDGNTAVLQRALFYYATTSVATTMCFCACCIASFALNLCTVATLVVLRGGGRLKKLGPELRLFGKCNLLW